MSRIDATFVEVSQSRRWRAFDWQLLVYLVVLIGFGLVIGYSANYQSAGVANGLPQTLKTLRGPVRESGASFVSWRFCGAAPLR